MCCSNHHCSKPKNEARNTFNRRHLLISLASLGLLPFTSKAWSQPGIQAEQRPLPAPGPKDTCPVCGMFVARYPDWVATIQFQDGFAVHFDGAKDMFKFFLNMPAYSKDRTADTILAIGVTDYYNTEMIDARHALFVVGSDVLSPMGHDLIPHPSRADAEEFLDDHVGRDIVAFDAIDSALLEKLDKGFV